MTIPALLFGFLLATLIAAMFHLWKGGGIVKLVLYVIMSWVGFWIGHYFSERLGWLFLDLGPLHLGLAILGSVLMLFFGYWLGLVRLRNAEPL
ncbi:MAG: hypothetical protein HPY76_08720 [Anaerolineae bacterium]|jgi:uncharacterized membrane protein YeaQ/YmgE (transglycosylase-associated protein family)|nr:hypothetical protein [Anaerolineae bacterium]